MLTLPQLPFVSKDDGVDLLLRSTGFSPLFPLILSAGATGRACVMDQVKSGASIRMSTMMKPSKGKAGQGKTSKEGGLIGSTTYWEMEVMKHKSAMQE